MMNVTLFRYFGKVQGEILSTALKASYVFKSSFSTPRRVQYDRAGSKKMSRINVLDWYTSGHFLRKIVKQGITTILTKQCFDSKIRSTRVLAS